MPALKRRSFTVVLGAGIKVRGKGQNQRSRSKSKAADRSVRSTRSLFLALMPALKRRSFTVVLGLGSKVRGKVKIRGQNHDQNQRQRQRTGVSAPHDRLFLVGVRGYPGNKKRGLGGRVLFFYYTFSISQSNGANRTLCRRYIRLRIRAISRIQRFLPLDREFLKWEFDLIERCAIRHRAV
jgi:hypothetical protein